MNTQSIARCLRFVSDELIFEEHEGALLSESKMAEKKIIASWRYLKLLILSSKMHA
ncbi:hypothetical protein OIU78_005257 [Salix suchowensis]|nr:hypothetical protein OIU78_005257 [Salix suchowensis]